MADQWALLEVAGLVGAGREALAFGEGRKEPVLRIGVNQPLLRFGMELSRPYFWHQPGSVETTAYATGGTVAYVHRLLSPVPGGRSPHDPRLRRDAPYAVGVGAGLGTVPKLVRFVDGAMLDVYDYGVMPGGRLEPLQGVGDRIGRRGQRDAVSR